MRLSNGTTLMHGPRPYDPVKAHEYYMRTRKLKGRTRGAPTFTVKTRTGNTVVLSARELAEQKQYAAERISNIKEKLNELNAKLRVAMREAQAEKAASEREAAKPKTAAEKAADARDAEKYRDKHKGEIASKRRAKAAKTKAAPKDPVAALETKIDGIKKKLKAAVAIQRALAGATRNN
jgi:hypothetical protein